MFIYVFEFQKKFLYIAQLWIWLFEVTHNGMKLLQIANFIWLMDFTQLFPIYVAECF